MRGDILLFFNDGTFFNSLIAHFTRGPFVHVGVDLGDGSNIAAARDGVKRRPTPPNGVLAIRASIQRIEDGIRFLEGQIGNGYGFIDIANQALKVLGSPVFLAARDEYDCSDLVTRYLAVVGGPVYLGLGDLAEEPHMVTPNDIARAAGLIDKDGVWRAFRSSRIGKPSRPIPSSSRRSC